MLMGPPGVGKGTQARLLGDLHGWVQLSTGDLFRDHQRRGTDLGRLANEYMSKGSYVPDEVTVRMVREWLAGRTSDERVIFDGFPRTDAQAHALDGLLPEFSRHIAQVVLIEVPRAELLARLGARATCTSCQAVYSLAVKPPRVEGACDRCGSPVTSSARPDEAPEVVRRRLDVYDEQTRPVVAYYEQRGIVQRIDGVGAVEEITARIVEAADGKVAA